MQLVGQLIRDVYSCLLLLYPCSCGLYGLFPLDTHSNLIDNRITAASAMATSLCISIRDSTHSSEG